VSERERLIDTASVCRAVSCLSVKQIQANQTHDWLMRVHYARRIPSISYAFGLFDSAVLVGVVTYGTPSSAPLRSGVCGNEFASIVLELNRLCLSTDAKNAASILVGRSLALLPRPSIVVSYADTSVGHVGYVYQACNFIYTGLSAKRTDWKIKGLERLHGQTVADISRNECADGQSRADYMRNRYGDDFYLLDRARKHRYIYFVGSKSQKKDMASALKYKKEPYPKGETLRYLTTETATTQMLLL